MPINQQAQAQSTTTSAPDETVPVKTPRATDKTAKSVQPSPRKKSVTIQDPTAEDPMEVEDDIVASVIEATRALSFQRQGKISP